MKKSSIIPFSYKKPASFHSSWGYEQIKTFSHGEEKPLLLLEGGRYYVVFIGCAPGIYDNWVKASRQVHKFAYAEHKSYKDRWEAESAYMEFLQRNGRNVQYGASPSWTSPNISISSPGGTSQSEGTNYCNGEVKNSLLRYHLDVAIEERDHARRIATLSTNMLNEVVAQVMGDDEGHDST